jgi:hypothetical protein
MRGVAKMSQRELERKNTDSQERDLLVAYLSYALDDVEAISRAGLHHLRMAISSIAEDPDPETDAMGGSLGRHRRAN